MEQLSVLISWSGNNYCATAAGVPVNGAIIVTNKTLEGVKSDFQEALSFHIEGLIADGDSVPEGLRKGNYELQYIA